jgi:hypothetical protein
MRKFFDGFLNTLRLWCNRQGFGFYALAVRENFEGYRREHFHVLLYVPERRRRDLKKAVRRWLPGDEKVVSIGREKFGPDVSGRVVNKALTYFLKQMTHKARVSLGWRVRRQLKCSETKAIVAPVLGKRYFISRSLKDQRQKAPAIATPMAAAA